MKTLAHGMLIRLPSWLNSYAIFGTSRAYFAEHPSFPVGDKPGLTVEERVARSKERGHEQVWCTYSGSTLSSDPGFYDRHAAKLATAVFIEPGEIVEVEGKRYTVKVSKPNLGKFPHHSNPIQFVEVEEPAEPADGLTEYVVQRAFDAHQLYEMTVRATSPEEALQLADAAGQADASKWANAGVTQYDDCEESVMDADRNELLRA